MRVAPHLDEVVMGDVRVCVQAAGDHLFWEQGVLGQEGVHSQQGLRVQGGDGVSHCPEPPQPTTRHTHTHTQTHWGALEQLILGEVFPEDKAAVSADRPGSLHFHHRFMVLQAPLWGQEPKSRGQGRSARPHGGTTSLAQGGKHCLLAQAAPCTRNSPSARWGWHSTSPQFSSLRA